MSELERYAVGGILPAWSEVKVTTLGPCGTCGQPLVSINGGDPEHIVPLDAEPPVCNQERPGE